MKRLQQRAESKTISSLASRVLIGYTELCDKCSDISDEYYDILEYIDINTISSKDILNDN